MLFWRWRKVGHGGLVRSKGASSSSVDVEWDGVCLFKVSTLTASCSLEGFVLGEVRCRSVMK